MAKTIDCPFCGKLTDPKLDTCPHCGGFMQKKGAAAASSGGQTAQRQRCSSCNAIVQEGDIVCVTCGANLLTGQKITEQRTSAPSRPAVTRPLWVAAAAVIAVVVLGGAAYGAYVAFRDPVTQANRLVEQNRISEANRLLEEYVSENPDDPRGLFALGQLQWRSRQYASAADSFERVQQVDPTEERAGRLALLSLRALDDPAHRNREISALERHLESYPNDAEAWYLLALARGSEGDVSGQVEALEQAIQLGVDAPESRSVMGVGLALQGQHQQAAGEIQAVLDDAPGDGDLQAALGFIAHMQGNNQDAIAHLENALNQGTALEQEARTQLGLLLVAEGRSGEAQTHLEAVTAGAGAPPAARFFHAVNQRTRGREQDALSQFEQLMDEDHAFAQHAAVQAADIYLERGQTNQARDSVERASRTLGETPALLTLRGRIHMMNNEHNDARDLFRRALQMDSNYAPARLENGLLLVQQRAFAEGIRELERYVELIDPDMPGARVQEVNALIEQLKRTGADGQQRARANTGARATARS